MTVFNSALAFSNSRFDSRLDSLFLSPDVNSLPLTPTLVLSLLLILSKLDSFSLLFVGGIHLFLSVGSHVREWSDGPE